MVSLELLIDASGMQRGADQAKAALGSLQTKARETETAVKSIGGTGAAQSTSGLLQVSSGISGIAQSLQNLNFSQAGTGIARTLLEISRTGQDFRQLTAGVSGATGAFGALGLVMRAHPILAIASVVGAVASAMALFSDKTDNAADSMAKARREGDALQSSLSGLAAGSGSKTGNPALDILNKLRGEDLSRALTFTENNNVIGGRGDSQFVKLSDLERVLPGLSQYYGQQFGGGVGPLGGARGARFSADEDERFVGRNQFISYLETSAASYQPPGGPSYFDNQPFWMRDGRDTATTSQIGNGAFRTNYPLRPTEQEDRDYERQQEDYARAQESLRAMVDDARQVGEYLGDGAGDLILGLRSGREVLASMLQDLVRMGVRQGFGNLFAAAANSFGATGAQGAGAGAVAGAGAGAIQ